MSTKQTARKAATSGYVARVGALRKGQEWLRSSESIYPLA